MLHISVNKTWVYIVGEFRTNQLLGGYQLLKVSNNTHLRQAKYKLFSDSMVLLKSHGAKCPSGSIDTIFFLSAHCGNGPIFEAGSVFVKSGLDHVSN